MSEKEIHKRIRERLALKLPVKVHCRETTDFEWTEMTRLTNVTPFGAGFILKRPVERGRLVHLTIPMPRQLRVFDHVEDQYKIWGLVRYLKAQPGEGVPQFEVGVAFIGKRAPASYDEDPSRRYDVAGSVTDTVTLLEVEEDSLPPAEGRDLREHTRHIIPIDMLVETLDQNNEVALSESTVTENVSKRGATIFTALDVRVGRFIRVTSQQCNTVAFAVVRSRSTGADGIGRIHVEFLGRDWPL